MSRCPIGLSMGRLSLQASQALLLHGAMLTIEGMRDELRFDGVERPQRPRWRDEDGGQRRTPRDILQAMVGYEGGDYLGGKY